MPPCLLAPSRLYVFVVGDLHYVFLPVVGLVVSRSAASRTYMRFSERSQCRRQMRQYEVLEGDVRTAGLEVINLAWRSLRRGAGIAGGRHLPTILGLLYRPRFAMAWNVFKFCTGLRVVGSVMILVVLAVVAVSYYAVVISNYGLEVLKGGSQTAIALVVLLLFHGLLVMLLWCYFTVVLTDPGGVPSNWRPITDEEDIEAQSMPLAAGNPAAGSNLQPSGPGGAQKVRFCRKCSQFKPPRCHHCSVCGRCILKMDHHCVWVVNCVGARNYKFFLLFLLYTFLETTLVTASLLPHFIAFFSDVDDESSLPGNLATTFLGFVLNLAFALSVLGFLIMHVSLVSGNTTTIEAYEKKASTRWRFDLGRRRNFEQVFGSRKLYWILPLYAEEDLRKMQVLHGLDYPTRFFYALHALGESKRHDDSEGSGQETCLAPKEEDIFKSLTGF
ncbi:hypothetical protein Mp_4g21000 [Marchantia polymorpha subsp. ruderalis]|uniref:S-acyltransferase n=2 Tax=Marchantia polymorpha TaxID=3197 RepID=A0AAF6BC63_MARPO|nr:hypothetical protein MARPO_0101s0046 [Marchantia polymorpha]BBN09597.1 hypothetical protein Mp_4g21000 [Marchantia polymorpha subsp. ruderalis]|eukprot:PTQ32255.1 hypothetical protein MARPO_0101s0046 [Marchantia polymorpha]